MPFGYDAEGPRAAEHACLYPAAQSGNFSARSIAWRRRRGGSLKTFWFGAIGHA
jgi:hypothetical protein